MPERKWIGVNNNSRRPRIWVHASRADAPDPLLGRTAAEFEKARVGRNILHEPKARAAESFGILRLRKELQVKDAALARLFDHRGKELLDNPFVTHFGVDRGIAHNTARQNDRADEPAADKSAEARIRIFAPHRQISFSKKCRHLLPL